MRHSLYDATPPEIERAKGRSGVDGFKAENLYIVIHAKCSTSRRVFHCRPLACADIMTLHTLAAFHRFKRGPLVSKLKWIENYMIFAGQAHPSTWRL